MTDEGDKYEGHCWQCIPCDYENFKREPNDQYFGDIFGQIFGFDSPHWLYRRFHKSYCKAQILANLSEYNLSETEDDGYVMNIQVSEIQEQNYSIELLAFHSSLVSMVSAFEIFLKNSFRYFLQYLFPEKIKNQNIDKIIRRYNFQNIESTIKAYKWLFDDFNESAVLTTKELRENYNKEIHGDELFYSIELYEYLFEMLNRRHRIVHESYYFTDLDKKRFEFYSYLCFLWASNFNCFFIDNHYYEKLDKEFNF
jgi:hypothetical protein